MGMRDLLNQIYLVREKGKFMSWDEVAGNWKQFKGNIREKWGKLTDNDLSILAGRRDQLLGQIQASCGIKPEEAEKELKDCGFLK
jgi:uncharacterized protein YjbJ (UPF0337 family)